ETNVRVTAAGIYGYNLSINSATANMVGQNMGSNALVPSGGGIDNPIPFSSGNCNAWGFATPGIGGNHSQAFDPSYSTLYNISTSILSGNYAAVPTSPTLIDTVDNNDPGNVDETRPYYFAFCAGGSTNPDTYSATVTWTAVGISMPTEPPISFPLMQEFTAADCSDMGIGGTLTLADARDNKVYRVRKMLDGKCWTIDSLAYLGGGDNTFGDAVPSGVDGSSGQLNIWDSGIGSDSTAPVSGIWDSSSTRRWVVLNTNPNVPIDPSSNDNGPLGGVRCQFGLATLDTDYLPNQGNQNMLSICGGQYLYSWCAAAGLDDSTVPTCAAVTNTGNGAGYASVGVIGAMGGFGGESLGSGGSTICPAGWRLPVGQVGTAATANNSKNEWAMLNSAWTGRVTAATPTLPIDTTNDMVSVAFWQPNNPNTDNILNTVSSGIFAPGYGLRRQSQSSQFWTSSIQSSVNSSSVNIFGDGISVGALGNHKNIGQAVRCVK
ncbi:fibrobacter succinogenes major paralogous domain-containing protein, partial [Candidatus Saccharibacteria bacterium]|nr:fibrobacter succinogenes major paralogous domain-containing protein [Candidatus Saccharibacteria bacterium]